MVVRYWMRCPCGQAAGGETVQVLCGRGSQCVVGVGWQDGYGCKGPWVFPALWVCCGLHIFVFWEICLPLLQRSRKHLRCDRFA